MTYSDPFGPPSHSSPIDPHPVDPIVPAVTAVEAVQMKLISTSVEVSPSLTNFLTKWNNTLKDTSLKNQ